MSHEDRVAGTLLGTALGDALGLATEGLSARRIARRFGRIEGFRLLGRTGFVSDDTELSALIAQSLIQEPTDAERCARAFRRSLLGWCCRLPWGAGRATLKAGLRIGLVITPSGVMSAGNGAAMRAAVIGSFFPERLESRNLFGRALAETTHCDPRAVEGALYVAELAAASVRGQGSASREDVQAQARRIVTIDALGLAVDEAAELARLEVDTQAAASRCKTTGFVVHSVAFATFGFLRYGQDPKLALTEVIGAGGDTDSIAAILGAWLGAYYGASGLPADLIARIHDGPFGPTHLRALAHALSRLQDGEPAEAPRYSPARAFARNLALFPVILGHGFRRLVPF